MFQQDHQDDSPVSHGPTLFSPLSDTQPFVIRTPWHRSEVLGRIIVSVFPRARTENRFSPTVYSTDESNEYKGETSRDQTVRLMTRSRVPHL
ncbi:MAG: hypothetical protein CMJ81_19875 [Planctomycetaceae bacterium]|nr:hypothetical protein [Planctomycetaceae bacterium]